MKIEKYECDYCRQAFNQNEVKLAVQIFDKLYDVCIACHDAIKTKLDGRGSPSQTDWLDKFKIKTLATYPDWFPDPKYTLGYIYSDQ